MRGVYYRGGFYEGGIASDMKTSIPSINESQISI